MKTRKTGHGCVTAQETQGKLLIVKVKLDQRLCAIQHQKTCGLSVISENVPGKVRDATAAILCHAGCFASERQIRLMVGGVDMGDKNTPINTCCAI